MRWRYHIHGRHHIFFFHFDTTELAAVLIHLYRNEPFFFLLPILHDLKISVQFIVAYPALKLGETAKVKRDGKIISDIVGEYLDYSALGTCTYSVIVIDSNDCFSESDKLLLTYNIKDVQLSLASDLSQSVHLNMQKGTGQAIRQASDKYDTAQNYYAGRQYPCIDFSEHSESSITLNFAYSKAEDFEKLMSICNRRETLLYRDKTGERFYCAVMSISNDKYKHMTDFTITMQGWII